MSKLDEDINSIVDLKKSEEEDFLRYECSEKVKKAIDLERNRQNQQTEEYENFLKEQLQDRLEKYTEFYEGNLVLLKEFLVIKNDMENQKLRERELQKRCKSICQKPNLKVYKTKNCKKIKDVNTIPEVKCKSNVKIEVKMSTNCLVKEKAPSNKLPEYFYFKKFNNNDFDRIYNKNT